VLAVLVILGVVANVGLVFVHAITSIDDACIVAEIVQADACAIGEFAVIRCLAG
jgi:hypothetical protein